MNSKSILKWFQLFLKREKQLVINPQDWGLLVSEILNEAQIFLVDKSQITIDFFKRQQISSIIEILQLIVKIIYLGDEKSIVELLNFIFLYDIQYIKILQDIPEIQNIQEQLSYDEQIVLQSNLKIRSDQQLQFDFSKYELLQIIEHIEAKYQLLNESQEAQNSQLKKQQEILKNELNQKDEQISLLNKQIEFQNLELDNIAKQTCNKSAIQNLQQQLEQTSCEKSQLIQFMQRQQSVIQEQEYQIEQYQKQISIKHDIKETSNNDYIVEIANLENKLNIFTDKIKELNLIVSQQRTEIAKLEVNKNLLQQQLDELNKQKNQEIELIQNELDNLKQQQQLKNNSDATIRSKLLSIHSNSSRNVLAQDLIELQEKTQNRGLSLELCKEAQDQIVKREHLMLNEKALYHEIIESLLLDLDEEKKNNQKFIKDIEELKLNYTQQIRNYTKQHQENIINNTKQKKIEQQNDLLKKIIDLFLFNGNINQ